LARPRRRDDALAAPLALADRRRGPRGGDGRTAHPAGPHGAVAARQWPRKGGRALLVLVVRPRLRERPVLVRRGRGRTGRPAPHRPGAACSRGVASGTCSTPVSALCAQEGAGARADGWTRRPHRRARRLVRGAQAQPSGPQDARPSRARGRRRRWQDRSARTHDAPACRERRRPGARPAARRPEPGRVGLHRSGPSCASRTKLSCSRTGSRRR
jgi:hypothetical protein